MSDQQLSVKPGPKNVVSALALANAASIATGVLQGIAGRAVATSINGSPLMRENIAQMVCARVTKILNDRHVKAKDMRLTNY